MSYPDSRQCQSHCRHSYWCFAQFSLVAMAPLMCHTQQYHLERVVKYFHYNGNFFLSIFFFFFSFCDFKNYLVIVHLFWYLFLSIFIWPSSVGAAFCGMKEWNILFNYALNTFYLQLYGVRHVVRDHSDRKRERKLTATTTWVTLFN